MGMRLLLIFLIVMLTSSCIENEYKEYEAKMISKIETEILGEYHMWTRCKRIFDFEQNQVLDIIDVDEEALNQFKQNSYNDFEYDDINNQKKVITTFTEDKKITFIKNIIFLNIYSWQDDYISKDVVCGSSSSITIYFTDCTYKSTIFYYLYPKNYEKIVSCFQDSFEVGCWYNS